TLIGGTGTDTVTYAEASGNIIVDLALNSASNDGDGGTDVLLEIENIIGSAYNDIIRGNAAANELSGGDGSDTLMGRGGADTLNGGNGNDTADYSQAAAGIVVNLLGGVASDDGDGSTDTLISIENITGSSHND